MSKIRRQIKSWGKIAPIALWEGGTNPEGIWEWLFCKNDVLMEEGQCLTDGGLIRAFRTIDIFKNYRFSAGAMRHTTSTDPPHIMEVISRTNAFVINPQRIYGDLIEF